MASDLTGVSGVRGAPIPPAAPARPAEPSRAIVPVPTVGRSEETAARGDGPLGRSGLSAIDLLLTSDLIVERDPVASVALEAGLETARAALLRRQPGQALQALDEIWARAATSEEGWYLRAGALTMLGQADEGDRVAAEGLTRTPQSIALRFLQSVSRALLGDLAGARSALLPTLDAAPEHPVLLAQHLLLQARQGRVADTEPQLRRLLATFPDHPATRWASEAFRAVRASQHRAASRPSVPLEISTVAEPVPSGPRETDPRPEATIAPDSTSTPIDAAAGEAIGASDATAEGDLGDAAFARLGIRLGLVGSGEALEDARALLRAFSTGGTLAAAVLPDQAHGARTVLAAIVGTLRGESPVGPARAPGASLMAALVPALRDGRTAEIERMIRRDARALPYPQRRWIDALLRDVIPSAASARRGRGEESVSSGEYPAILSAPRHDGPEVPVRLGLSLLTDSAAARLALRTPEESLPVVARDTPSAGALAAAMLVTPRATPPRGASAEGGAVLGAVLPPVLAIAVAVAAGLNGASFVAGVALTAAVWLAVRRPTAVADADATRSPDVAVSLGRPSDEATRID